MKTPHCRRQFLRQLGFSGAAFTLLRTAAHAWSFEANQKLNVALVGVGGRGTWFVDTIPRMENVVALCDVNDRKMAEAFQRWSDTAERFEKSTHDYERKAAGTFKRLVEQRPRQSLQRRQGLAPRAAVPSRSDH